jgi:hypothetical protein
MLFMLVSIILSGLLLCGSGCLFGKFFGYSSMRNPWIYFWLGFFIISTLSMLTSLFIPINVISLFVFFIIGTIGLFFFFRESKQSTIQYDKAEKTIFLYIVLLTLIIITCLGAYTSWPGMAYDTDLYHAQTIRWYNEYSTPPGLGNLHSRLAFNSSWFSMAALFDNGIWDNRSAWIMSALALLGGILYFLHELVFSRKNGICLYALCILLWILLKVVSGAAIPSLDYDYPVLVLNAIIVLEAYYLFVGYSKNLSKKEIHDAAKLLMLGVSAFMIKPIGAVSLLFSGILTLFFLAWNTKQTISYWFKIYVPAICAFAVWVTKNMFLSGYLVYPLPIFPISFDWTMPFESVEANYKDVLAWARMPGPGYRQSLENGFMFWLKPWLIGNLKSKFFLLLVGFPSFLSIIIWFLIIRYNDIKKAFYFLIWTFFSIVYWFVTVPDLRFGDGFFWVFLGTACLFAAPDTPIFAITGFWKNQKIRIVFFYFWGLCIICMIGYAVLSSHRNLLTIGTIPSMPVKEHTVNADPPFVVWVPDVDDDRTGNSPLPSTPYAPSNLEMREPGNLGKGFRPIRH